ncbi:hypothetical protein A3Q56_03157, partial [Intoshia linei]
IAHVRNYDADKILNILKPLLITFAIVIFSTKCFNFVRSGRNKMVYIPFQEDSSSGIVWKAIVNVLIIIAIVVVMTFIFILLYKYRFYKVINAWLILSTVPVLFLFSMLYIENVFSYLNLRLDWFTLSFIVWNFGVVGTIAVHWLSPIKVRQSYLILISALIAMLLIQNFPRWTTWVLLGGLAIYDLFAVLLPSGPLNMLVKIAQERNEPIFASLIYTAGVAFLANGTKIEDKVDNADVLTDDENGSEIQSNVSKHSINCQDVETSSNIKSGGNRISNGYSDSFVQDDRTNILVATSEHVTNDSVIQNSHNDSAVKNKPRRRNNAIKKNNYGPRPVRLYDDEEVDAPLDTIKLGLGDFIFYSVLIGLASIESSINTTIVCCIAVLMGLISTVVILNIKQRALPALPISIFLGLALYFSSVFMEPLGCFMAANMIMI